MPHGGIAFLGTAGLLSLNATLPIELITFLLMLGAMAKWAYPPILAEARARQKVIADGLEAAQQAERRLREVTDEVDKLLEEARGQAKNVIARARDDARTVAEELKAAATQQAEAASRMARGEIDAERDRALLALRAEFADLVVDAAAQVLGRSIDTAIHQELIEESLTSMVGKAK